MVLKLLVSVVDRSKELGSSMQRVVVKWVVGHVGMLTPYWGPPSLVWECLTRHVDSSHSSNAMSALHTSRYISSLWCYRGRAALDEIVQWLQFV